MSSGTKIYDSTNQPAAFNAVVEAIAKTDRIIFLCGPDLSTAAGMAALNKPSAINSNGIASQMSLSALIKECSSPDRGLSQLPNKQLAAYNMAMAERRIRARSAPINTFHQYFQRVFGLKHVVRYLTTSFDALEAAGKRAVESKCPGVREKDVTAFDGSFLRGATLLCEDCPLMAEQPSTSRRQAQAALSNHLRPAVQANIGIDMLPGGKLRNKVITGAKSTDLLLIAGISLQADEIMDLAQEIAEEVHGRYGGVVYIGEQPICGRTAKYHVDFHLKMDPDECAHHIFDAMERLQAGDVSMEPSADEENDKSDIWSLTINSTAWFALKSRSLLRLDATSAIWDLKSVCCNANAAATISATLGHITQVGPRHVLYCRCLGARPKGFLSRRR
ncbi:hypothetical protein BN14_07294 [Rhizoctonia solani AG-1 IB]|uniref:Uncharacterized protein n=1 Tax=Thanatephorus cucumeris (strain AG1-IB / isolate 7/3/14) TaxID=1108050 RepID=M5C181_THACB|nr:hypothetical protein BN14_07294 [Rhizoctonia solani AG-1 IB]